MHRLAATTPLALALLTACGEDPGTSSSDSASTTAPATTTSASTSTDLPTTSGDASTTSTSGDDAGQTETGSDTTTTTDTTTTNTTTTSTTTTTTDTTAGETTTAPPTCGDGNLDADEACDDGNALAGDGCSDLCTLELCGDGTVQPGLGETCDDANTAPDDGCSDLCIVELCGDATVQPGLGEACDDGNILAGDGCSPTCTLEPVGACDPGSQQVLVNADFETGQLAPWFSEDDPTVTMTMPHAGTFAAETIGGIAIRQDFAAVPVNQLVAATLWSWHVAADNPIIFLDWGYADNTTGNSLFIGDQLDGWVKHDLLGNMNQNKSLIWLRAYGYAGGGNLPDISRYDDFRLCRKL